MQYRLVGPMDWEAFFDVDQLFNADHYVICKLITDWGQACRTYFEIEPVEDDGPSGDMR